MPKLNQIIAIEKGTKDRVHTTITAVHHQAQKAEPFAGIERTYKPRDDDGEILPSESKRVQAKATDLIDQVHTALVELFDVTATKDWANCEARADVNVDGQVLLSGVPITYLLFLEHKLVDLNTFVRKLPVLDPAEDWTWDPGAGAWTASTTTTRSKKVPRTLVKAEATPEHAAQVDVWQEDIVVGDWTTKKLNSSLQADEIQAILNRLAALQRAVKFAREEANTMDVETKKVGEKILAYVFDSSARTA